MSEIRDDLLYTNDHEWLKISDGTVTVGITDYAQNNLGDVVFIELPDEDELEKGAIAATIESVKAVAEVYSPLKGQLDEVNENLESEPALLNTDNYNGGWIFTLKASEEINKADFMDANQYREFLETLE